MKIVFLQDDFPPYAKGGAGIVAASFTGELVRNGNDLTVITSVQKREQAGSFIENSMRVERIYSDYQQRWRSWLSLYNPATVPEIRRILAEVQPDIVHAHNVHYHLSYWALYLAKKSGAKVFLTAHDVMLFHYGKLTEFIDIKHPECREKWNYKISALQQLHKYRFWYNPLRNIIIRYLLKNVNRIFAVSAALKDALEQNGITNIEVIHNGIDVEQWQSSQKEIDAFIDKHHLKNKKVILFGGRISVAKGGDVILSVLRDVVRTKPNVVLLILGIRDAYVEELIQRAEEWGISKNIVSTGWLSGSELRSAYYAADIVTVLSNCFDSLPTVALEAMACGKPVVGSCLGGIPEIVTDGKTGYIINPYNKERLVSCVIEIIDNKEKKIYLGDKGYERVKESFSIFLWYEYTLSVYT